MENKNIKWLSLQFFADGGEGAGGAGEGGAQTGAEMHGDADRATGDSDSSMDLSDVVYGIGGGEEGTNGTLEDLDAGDRSEPEDMEAEFEKLIAKDGKFRDVYEKRVADIVSRRLRSVKQTATVKNGAQDEAVQSVLEELAKRYNVNPSDTAAVAKAFLEDEERLEEEAMERGVSTEEWKRQKADARELESYRREKKLAKQAEAVRQRQEDARAKYDGWMREAEELKKIYPEFDIEAESKNPKFIQRLQNGTPMQEIYEGMHHQELMQKAMAYTADKVEKGTADKIRANAARPTEGAARSRASTVHKQKVEDLTGQDIREILKRVEGGAKISF